MSHQDYVCNEGCDLPVEKVEQIETDACNKSPGFLSRFSDICKYKFSGLKVDISVVFIYLIAIITALVVLAFGYSIGQSDYDALNQPTSEIEPWVVLLITAIGIILGTFGSYILHQMSDGIVRYTFMLTFLMIILLQTIAFIALYLFASPLICQYISLIAIVICLWTAVFAATISYISASLFILNALALGFLFVVSSRISSVN